MLETPHKEYKRLDSQVCNKCHTEKHISYFEWQKNRPSPRKTCKLCRSRVPRTEAQIKKRAEYAKNLYSRNRDHYRAVAEKSLYGVSKNQFEYDYCAICGSKEYFVTWSSFLPVIFSVNSCLDLIALSA